MLYPSLIIIGISAILLLIYNRVIVRWLASRHSSAATHNTSSTGLQRSIQAIQRSNSSWGISVMLHIFKYKKESEQSGNDDQCAVCLSVFEEAEDLKLLPRCKHSFHKQCIDMWLYSHLDCPICRTTVVQPSASRQNQKSYDPPVAVARQDTDPISMV